MARIVVAGGNGSFTLAVYPIPLLSFPFNIFDSRADEFGVTTSFSDHLPPAVIQVPSPAGDGSKRRIPCTFNGMHGKRLSLEAGEALPMSTVISVEYDDELFLGEVVSCVEAERAWDLQIKVEQILTGLQSLMALRARLLSEGAAQPLRLLPIGARN